MAALVYLFSLWLYWVIFFFLWVTFGAFSSDVDAQRFRKDPLTAPIVSPHEADRKDAGGTSSLTLRFAVSSLAEGFYFSSALLFKGDTFRSVIINKVF